MTSKPFIVRVDDILNQTRSKFKGKELDRFKFINKMINETNGKLIHYPTILCTDIEAFPEAIEYIKEETKQGRMIPQLHGWEHKDYVNYSSDKIVEMLDKSIAWFQNNLDTEFTIWATPWGGDSQVAREACEWMGITLQTTNNTLTPGDTLRAVRGRVADQVPYRIILHHWWDRGLNLFRLCEVFKHGSWEVAKEADTRGWF